MNSISPKFRLISPYFILLLITAVGFWQITFLQNTMKWDMMDQFFPTRYLISECFNNGIFPLWNPYQNLGTPIHADPQSGVFYPVVWLISFIWGYNIYSIQMEFLFHVFIAGLGMYMLAKELRIDKNVSLILGVSYQLSGFFIGNAQHLPWIISAAWIPFIFLYYHRLLSRQAMIDAVKVGFFMFLHLTGGYAAFSIITNYILLLLFIVFIVDHYRKKDYNWIKYFVWRNILILLVFVLLSSGFLISLMNVMDHMTRQEPLTLERVNIFCFSPQSMLSFILPFAVLQKLEFFNTDISMSNIYMGLLPLLFFILSLLLKKNRIKWFILVIGGLALLTAFGEYFFLRSLLYYFPLMDLFRNPSLFRLFTIISFLLLSGYALTEFIQQQNSRQQIINKLKWIVALLAAIIALLVIYSLFKSQTLGLPYLFNLTVFLSFYESSGMYEHIIVQGSVQLLLLAIFFWILHKNFNAVRLLRAFLLLTMIDMLLSAGLNSPITVLADMDPKSFHEKVSQLPAGFPIPDNTPIIAQSHTREGLYPIWYNVSMMDKKVAHDGFNSFYLKGYEHFYLSEFKDTILQNPLLFLTNDVRDIKEADKNIPFSKKTIFVEGFDFDKNVIRRLSDTVENQASLADNEVNIIEFNPNYIKASVVCSQNLMLTLIQNNYTGWQVKVDNEQVPYYLTNYSLLSTFFK